MSWSYDATNLNTLTGSGRLTKNCNGCQEKKETSHFNFNPTSKDGFYSLCKLCKTSRDKVYRQSNKSKIKNRQKTYYNNNRGVWDLHNTVRRSMSKKAKPKWLSKAQLDDIKNLYFLARDCTTFTGQEYHVDHIVPIKGANVCGLHVPWNLQVLPADINATKHNKFDGGW